MAAIIFDFDGTIVDNRNFIIEFIAKEANKYPLSTTEMHKLYGVSVVGIARHLGFSWWSLPKLFFKGRKSMAKAMPKLKPYKGISEIIRKLHNEGHQIFIVSSNSLKNIKLFLRHQNLTKQIMAIYGGIEVFGKTPVYRELIKDFSLDIENIICIGDELRDIEAAQAVKLKTVGVTWGFSSHEELSKLKPTWIVENVADLMNILEVV